MIGTLSGSKGPTEPSEPSEATPTRLRSAAARAQGGNVLIISCVFLALMGIMAWVATELSMTSKSSKSSLAIGATPHIELQVAKITSDPDGKGCFQQQFDNKTGRVTRLQEPCETVARDNNGISVPVGTIRRLDAISKAFSGR